METLAPLPNPPTTLPIYNNPNLSNNKNLFGMKTWYKYTIFPIVVLLSPIIILVKGVFFLLSTMFLIISMWIINLGTDVSKPLPKKRAFICNYICRICSRMMMFFFSGFIVIEKNRKRYTKAEVKPRIIVANHSSVLDAMTIGSIGVISPVAKESLATVWAYRQILVGLRTILVHRPFEKTLKKPTNESITNVQYQFPASDLSSATNSDFEGSNTNSDNSIDINENSSESKDAAEKKPVKLLIEMQKNKQRKIEKTAKKMDAIAPKSVTKAIEERAQPECKEYPPVAIFPEGTVTNPETIIKFKTGAFRPMVPVQPVTFKYYGCHKLDWLYERISHIILCTFLNPFGIVVIDYLPQMGPTAEELKNNDVHSFSDRVSEAMAENLKIEKVPYSSDDTMFCSGYKKNDYSKCTEAYIHDYISRELGTYEQICKALGKGKINPKTGKFIPPFACITNKEVRNYIQKTITDKAKEEK